MLEQYELPQWIKDLIEYAEAEDAERLKLHGYMLVAGIVMRTATTDAETLVTTVPCSTINAIPNDEMKQLVSAYCQSAWGAEFVQFFTTVKDRRISTEDRAYFHIQFIQKHEKRSAKARSQD